ncbi:MAG TPA: DUF4402 domain-containing protein [Sphingomicrobium sp.]|jgi:hypothetical protein|nr:DUF4402 domain-containing protein [Sphingomicrobium sp.]
MKKLLISAGALAVLALGTPAFAATQSANATVNIVSPLTLTKGADLNFGTIVGPFAGEVVHVPLSGARTCGGLTCSGTWSPAAFSVTGTAGQQLALTIPDSITLNRAGGGSLSVDVTSDKPANPTLDSGGNASFTVGGQLTIPAGTLDGVYTNTFDVTANYQ